MARRSSSTPEVSDADIAAAGAELERVVGLSKPGEVHETLLEVRNRLRDLMMKCYGEKGFLERDDFADAFATAARLLDPKIQPPPRAFPSRQKVKIGEAGGKANTYVSTRHSS